MTEFRQSRVGRTAGQAAVLAGLLTGCAGNPDAGPVAWWHHLEGGPIAASRPPPPGQTAPYPSLATVPAKPKPTPAAAQAKTYAGLAADRADATYEAKQDPLSAATVPRDQNGLFAPAPAPPPNPDAAGAALDATSSAPPPKPVSPTGPPAAPPSVVDTPIPDIAVDTGPVPQIPDQPPTPPILAGVQIPITVPSLPPKAPAPPVDPAVLSAAQRAPIDIDFAPGSAVLTVADQATLRSLALRRGPHPIELIGFGEAEGEDPQSQYAGVKLGLLRARAMGAALEGDGVPATALDLSATAPGNGGAARLTD